MEPIGNEIKWLQLLTVISPVRCSAYAAPIVAVKKKDECVRICANGIKPSPEKIKTLQNIPPPTFVKQLQVFLGAVTWYGKLIPDIKKHRGRLDELLQDDITFAWEAKHQESFDEFKIILASDLGLAHYDPTKKFIADADASS